MIDINFHEFESIDVHPMSDCGGVFANFKGLVNCGGHPDNQVTIFITTEAQAIALIEAGTTALEILEKQEVV